MAEKIRSFSDAAREAGLPVQVSREFIAELGPVVWYEATPTTAENPQTHAMDDVLLAKIKTDDGHIYQTIVGNVALRDVLDKVDLPFKARIVKSGRTWVFED